MKPSQISDEEWRPIADYGGVYEVSNRGRVYSHKRRGKILNGGMSKGYRTVALSKAGVVRYLYIHALVAAAFHGERPPGNQVRHLDGDHLNNFVDNLAWGTAKENAADQLAHGRHRNARRDCCVRGHLLDGANLAPWESKASGRKCLACSRAWAHIRDMKLPKPVIKPLSDEKYQKIMAPIAA